MPDTPTETVPQEQVIAKDARAIVDAVWHDNTLDCDDLESAIIQFGLTCYARGHSDGYAAAGKDTAELNKEVGALSDELAGYAGTSEE